MTTLADFLLARIAEDEASLPDGFDCWYPPERYEAECAAKRRIVEDADTYVGEYENESWRTEDGYAAGRVAGRARSWRNDILRALALPYADHPDYRDEWRP